MVGAFFMSGEICFLCPFLRKEVSTVANRIMGITVEISGDTTKLKTALKGVNGQIKSTQQQLKDVDKHKSQYSKKQWDILLRGGQYFELKSNHSRKQIDAIGKKGFAKSASPLPVPNEFKASPEKVGYGLAKHINSKRYIICHSFNQKIQTMGCYVFPIKMGTLLSKMTANVDK